jgi:GT2 family glycosyltransferase
MITIIYSTHKDSDYNSKFKQHLLQNVGLKEVQILEYQNNNEYSLAQVYNSGITESIYDIIVCCHNDIKLEKGWGKKLIKDFEDNPIYGIIGKAGSCYFPESGVYWEKLQQTMVGQVYHHPENQNKWLNTYSPKLPFLVPVVTIDGLFISFDKTKIKHTFDETIGKFHFYDHPFCLSNYLDGVKIGVTSSFEITHQSVGQPNQEFFESKEVFLKKFKEKLPLDLKPEKVYIPNNQLKKIKKPHKVSIIIPTKNKFNLLKDCVESFYEFCDKSLFEIIVADTGSDENEKLLIKEFLSKYDNTKIVEYDYYNFSKINNDVVKNHVGEDVDLLLFSNNDIKILNDIIHHMINVFEEIPIAGTVGARLHFKDNTIQHDGILTYYLESKNYLGVTHMNFNNYYNYQMGAREVIGNTAALMMIRKNVFIKCGMYNENYTECLEDVELNLKCITLGYKNYMSNAVSYHYESQTRNEDPNRVERFNNDYKNLLGPFMVKNLQKLTRYIKYMN